MSDLLDNQSWKTKKDLLFDLDGILLDQQFNHFFWDEVIPKEYAKNFSMSLTQAKSLISAELKALIGTMELYSLKNLEKKLGLDLLKLIKQHGHLIKLNKYSEKFLFYINNLQDRPKCYLISNEHPELLNYKVQLTGLDLFFDVITSSYEIGVPKQNVTFWLKYFKYVNIEPKNAVLFESDSKVVQSAFDSACDAGLKIIASENTSQNNSQNNLLNNKQERLQYINNLQDLLPANLSNLDIIYAK